MAKVPRWAQEIASEVAPDAPIRWRWSDRWCSTGSTCYEGKNRGVVVTAGNRAQFVEVKLVLLHELAHWLTPKAHHGTEFWRSAWGLYRRFDIPDRVVLHRESMFAKCRQHQPG